MAKAKTAAQIAASKRNLVAARAKKNQALGSTAGTKVKEKLAYDPSSGAGRGPIRMKTSY